MNQGGIQVLMDTKKTWALFFVVLLGSLLTCVSCGSIEERISDIDSRNSTGVESSQLSPDYSDKTKLVYLVPEEYKHGDKTVNAINEYLDEKGAPYYMEFQGLPNSDTNEYETMVKKHIGSADLLFTGRSGTGYVELAGEEALFCLDEYLHSEEGKRLYESLPVDNWYAVTIGDSIYGVTGYPYGADSAPSYIVNGECMEEYGISEEDLRKPLYELEDVIRRVYEGERAKGNTGFVPISVHFPTCDHFCGEFYFDSYSVTMNEETEEAHLLIENLEYVKWLRSLYDFYRKGYIQQFKDRDIGSRFLSLRFGTGVPTELASYGSYRESGVEDGKTLTITLNGYTNYSQRLPFATAISADSANQSYALDFLTKVFTDAHLTNLMLHGAGYESMLDSKGKLKPESPMGDPLAYGNYYISVPQFFEYIDMKDRYFEFHNGLKKSRFTGFCFDVVPVTQQIEECDGIFSRFLTGLPNTGQDFDTYLAECRQQLLEAGAQDIIDEANRQFDEFKREVAYGKSKD